MFLQGRRTMNQSQILYIRVLFLSYGSLEHLNWREFLLKGSSVGSELRSFHQCSTSGTSTLHRTQRGC